MNDDTCPACEGDGLDQCGQFRMIDGRVAWETCSACAPGPFIVDDRYVDRNGTTVAFDA